MLVRAKQNSPYHWIDKRIISKNFPIHNTPADVIIVNTYDLGLLSYGFYTTKEILAAARKKGFKRPKYEDALHRGKNSPMREAQNNIVFLHGPWKDSDGRKHRSFLKLSIDSAHQRFLVLDLPAFRGRWGPFTRFAFRH